MTPRRFTHNARYAKLRRKVWKVEWHMQEHSEAQGRYSAARCNFSKIAMRIENRIIDVVSGHLLARDYGICPLMKIKLSVCDSWNKLRSFTGHNNSRWHIKDKTIAAFNNLRPIVKWINPSFGSIFNIRLACRNMGNLTQSNHLVMNCLHLYRP